MLQHHGTKDAGRSTRKSPCRRSFRACSLAHVSAAGKRTQRDPAATAWRKGFRTLCGKCAQEAKLWDVWSTDFKKYGLRILNETGKIVLRDPWKSV
jgi:hypothetical protein